jgi:glycosyltransferase involved in cell wall biosynthesis
MLSVIIPSRNEPYLERTIRNILENAEGNIEIIVELDGYLPEPPINIGDNRVIFFHHEKGIGQRACINHGVKECSGEFIMKLDAHCAVGKGFDVILARDCEQSWTMIPTMYNLDHTTWKPKLHKRTDYMYIGCDNGRLLRAEYYGSRQPKSDKQIDETMCCMGPGWFMHKSRFIEQGGCDENHEGGWGQQGVEVACKAWLSGGALMVNKKTWFAHWFRGGGGPGFPYPISGNQIERVRTYSRDLWLNNKWPQQTRTFQWLIDKFDPPGWDTSLTIIYYTANVIAKGIEYSVLRGLRGHGYPIISVSQEPMQLGKNIVVPKERSLTNIYRQVLVGAKEAKTEFVALCEDDCLYTKEHFKYRPRKPFAYNLNRWMLHLDQDQKIFTYRERPVLSQCIANRKALIECLEKGDRDREMGREDGYEFETFRTKEPNLIFCHDKNTSGKKYLGKDAEPKTDLPPWGTAEYWVTKFDKRKSWK